METNRCSSKSVLQQKDLQKSRRDASLKRKTIFSYSGEGSDPSIVGIADRHLAPSYPGFSISSGKAGHMHSLKSKVGRPERPGPVSDSYYELASLSSDQNSPVPNQDKFESFSDDGEKDL